MSTNIITIIGTFVSYLNNSLIYSDLCNYKYKHKITNYLLMIIISVVNVLFIYKLPIITKPIYNLLSLCLIIYLIKKDTFKSILYYIFCLWLVGILLDIIFMTLFSPFLDKFLNIFSIPIIGMLIISLLVQFALNLFFKIPGIKRITLGLKSKLDLIKNIIWWYIVIIITVVMFGIMSFKNITSFKIESLCLFLIFVFLSLSAFLIKVLYEERVFKLTISNLLKNNKYYLESSNKGRIFRHNIVHRLNSIKSVANDKAINLINDLINEYQLNNDIENVESLPNGINGIICQLLFSKKHQRLNIAINNYVENNLLDVLSPRKYNRLCETLGVCLDNAISAAESSNEKVLQIVCLENKQDITIKIINTFNSELEIDKLGTINYTTKSNGHGLGLFSLLKRKDVYLKTSIINNLFENQIKINKKPL